MPAPKQTDEAYADLAAPDPGVSRDAKHSTYTQVDPPDDNPPPGPMVEQTLGAPTEVTPQAETKSESRG